MRALVAAIGALACWVLPAAAQAATEPSDQIVVRFRDESSGQVRTQVARSAGHGVGSLASGRTRVVRVRRGGSPLSELRRLRRDPRVASAHFDLRVHASDFVPDDPAFRRQWNFNGPFGIGMPAAWQLASNGRAAGGRGTVVAVVDTGLAYETRGRYRRAPDVGRVTRGFDFVGGDRHPNDDVGHGTHVAGTIAQATDNGIGTAGVAYGARIMPIRVLGEDGGGYVSTVARGIRYASRHGADVINLSLELDLAGVRSRDVPVLASAIADARRRGAVVVVAAGNLHRSKVPYPANSRHTIGVGATTVHGCLARYSNRGRGLDIVAPGGGTDDPPGVSLYDRAACRAGRYGPDILQETFTGASVARFGLAPRYEGTSMAAPHVAGVAALLIAARRRAGFDPSPTAIAARLQRTARDIGKPGADSRYGHGLLDAPAALRGTPSQPARTLGP